MKKILIIEDDPHINSMLVELLNKNGYAPTSAFSGTEALLLLAHDSFDLVLLDLMLPGKSGEEVLGEMKGNYPTPVIVLTAKTDKETTVSLLKMGAEDYLTKPFDNEELLARIEVQLRRFNVDISKKNPIDNGATNKLIFQDLVLDLDGFDAFISNKKVGLSKREFELLHLLMSHPQKVFTKNNLYETVWGSEFFGDDNT